MKADKIGSPYPRKLCVAQQPCRITVQLENRKQSKFSPTEAVERVEERERVPFMSIQVSLEVLGKGHAVLWLHVEMIVRGSVYERAQVQEEVRSVAATS